MIDFWEIFSFQSREVLAVALGLLFFVVTMYVYIRIVGKNQTGIAIVVAICAALIGGWYFYQNNFYGWERTLAIVLYVVIFLVFLRLLLWPFFRAFGRR